MHLLVVASHSLRRHLGAAAVNGRSSLVRPGLLGLALGEPGQPLITGFTARRLPSCSQPACMVAQIEIA